MHTTTREFEKGMDDENYYSEIWIPVKKKRGGNILQNE